MGIERKNMGRHIDAMERKGLGKARKVIQREYRPGRSGGYQIAHHLECGHVVVSKESEGRPDRKLCRLCVGGGR